MLTEAYVLGRHYPDLCEWWRARGWPPPPADSMPVNGVIAVDNRGLRHAAVFYYFCEGSWAWLDYLVTNPDAPILERARALELVVTRARDNIVATKASLGLPARIMNVTEHDSVAALLGKLGFVRGDRGVTTLVWQGGL